MDNWRIFAKREQDKEKREELKERRRKMKSWTGRCNFALKAFHEGKSYVETVGLLTLEARNTKVWWISFEDVVEAADIAMMVVDLFPYLREVEHG